MEILLLHERELNKYRHCSLLYDPQLIFIIQAVILLLLLIALKVKKHPSLENKCK